MQDACCNVGTHILCPIPTHSLGTEIPLNILCVNLKFAIIAKRIVKGGGLQVEFINYNIKCFLSNILIRNPSSKSHFFSAMTLEERHPFCCWFRPSAP